MKRLATIALGVCLAGCAAWAAGTQGIPSDGKSARLEAGRWSVLEFGAKGDGQTDETAAFQAALDAADAAGGGTVHAPPGQYLFAGRLAVPEAVTLQGSWQAPPSHMGVRGGSRPKPVNGTVLLATADRDNEDAAAFISLTHNSVLRGVVIYYPEQNREGAPAPYPFAVDMKGDSPALLDVELLNPYKGVNATRCPRFLIRNVVGQPLRLGVYIDAVHDIGRMENVHFNPFWRWDQEMIEWMAGNGEAFVIGRTDWQYALNTFCLGYRIGYHFIKTEAGEPNGNFLGIGADRCVTAVQVDAGKRQGLRITNGEFVSVPRGMAPKRKGSPSADEAPPESDPTMVVIGPGNVASVRFTNCAFWGHANQIAKIDGRGVVGFTDCTFREWDLDTGKRAAIQARNGTLLVRGCEFNFDAPQIDLAEGVNGAIIVDNVFTGEERIHVAEGVKARVEGNLDAGVPSRAVKRPRQEPGTEATGDGRP
jgi:hypothetical protein